MRVRRLRTALVSSLPLAAASALVVTACFVPGLDGDFKVDPSATEVDDGSTSSSSGDVGSTSSSTSGGGASSSSTSSSASSSGTSSGTTSGGADGGVDAGPQGFCATEKQRATVKFCSDFTTGDAPTFDGWTTETRKVKGTTGTEGTGAERQLVAKVDSGAGPNFPGVGIAAVIADGVPVGKTLTMRFQFRVDPASNTYADVGLVQVGPPTGQNTQRGIGLDRCKGDLTKMCLQENDGLGGATGSQLALTANATYVGQVTVTRAGTNAWSSVVTVESPNKTTLATRATNAFTAADDGVRVIVGAENAGDFGTSTTFRVDNVVVEVK